MFKRLLISFALLFALLGGLFGVRAGMDHLEGAEASAMHCDDTGSPCEPMSQACAAHCLDAAVTSYTAPLVSPDVFSVYSFLLLAVAGWMLFAREDSGGLLTRLRLLGRRELLGFPNRLQYVRCTVFRE